MTINDDDIEPTPCSTAKELIDRLTETPDDPRYRFISPSEFIYRGVFDARLPLLASAFRDNPPPFGRLAVDHRHQANMERESLRHFFEAAYHEGLTIPDWDFAKSYIYGLQELTEMPRLLMALAQHHGTPTRMLDWTTDPLVAAYFAATFPNSGPCALEGVERMAVWSLNTHVHAMFQPIQIPYDLNQNARAQRGVFVEYEPIPASYQTPPPLRRSMIQVARYFASVSGLTSPEQYMKKYTLPRTEATSLLNLLRRLYRISGATMFPGYYGVARYEREVQEFGE